jgi:hypothetical protein
LVHDPLLPAKVVLDLHGLAEKKEYGAIIGTGKGKTLLGFHWFTDKLKLMFEAAGMIDYGIDVPEYASVTAQTIASFTARELHIPALQLEFRADWRDPDGEPLKYFKLLSILCMAVETFSSYIV